MQNSDFTYFISERNFISVVSLLGRLEKPALPIFPKILDDISQRRARMVIFNCHDLKFLEPNVMLAFAELISCVKSTPVEICFCFVAPDLKASLMEAKVALAHEFRDNLYEAVGSFLNKSQKAS